MRNSLKIYLKNESNEKKNKFEKDERDLLLLYVLSYLDK